MQALPPRIDFPGSMSKVEPRSIDYDRRHQALVELEARQDQLLKDLESLDQRLNDLLAEWNPPPSAAPVPYRLPEAA